MLEIALATLAKGGKIGAVGLILSALGKMGGAFGFVSQKFAPIFSALDSLGLALAVGGIAFHAKAATDIYVKREAEKATQTMGAAASSVVPAIQREIFARTGVLPTTPASAPALLPRV